MTANDFDQVFGGATAARPKFADRLNRAGTASTEAVPVPGVYRAYGSLPTNSIGESCEVSRWIDGTEISEGVDFQYRFLTRIGFVGEAEIRLFLPDCIVLIEGKNLLELRRKLSRRQVTFIQQYSGRVWPKPPAPGEPIIDQITIIRPSAA